MKCSLYVWMLVLVCGLIGLSRQDDQFVCCMGGLKVLKNVDVCPDECCYGYREKSALLPRIGLMSWCEKIEVIPEVLPSEAKSENPWIKRLFTGWDR